MLKEIIPESLTFDFRMQPEACLLEKDTEHQEQHGIEEQTLVLELRTCVWQRLGVMGLIEFQKKRQVRVLTPGRS